MTGGQALAVLVIAGFTLFVLWGRTAAGRALLIRLFGSPSGKRAAVPQRKNRSSIRRSAGSSKSPSRKPRGAARRQSPKRANRK